MRSHNDISPPDKPYVGPVPFQRKDQPLFFGREHESDELLSLITAHPVVLCYSQSGAGKTSLINAGLIPLLEQSEFRIVGPARVKGEIPSGFDYERNPYVFNVVNSLANIYPQITTANTRTIVDCLTNAGLTQKDGQLIQPTVLILDQFEELFTHNPELWKYRRGFFEEVGAALKDSSLRVLFAMREDFIAEMDPYEVFLPEKMRTRFRLERLRKPAALAAIEGPLNVEPWKKYKREFAPKVEAQPGVPAQPGVAEQLVDNLCEIPGKIGEDGKVAMSEFVEPLQLQLVCQAIWEKLGDDERVITANHIAQFGDVNAVLTAFYEACLKSAVEKSNEKRPANEPELREPSLRVWFDRKLITETGKRSMVFRGAHDTEGIPNRAVDELDMRHLIRAELRDGERWYELSHDRFLQPIKESYKRWLLDQPGAEQTRIRLEEKALEWSAKRDDALLLDANETFEARRWLDESEGMTYSDRLVAYVTASEAAQQERTALRRKQRVRQMTYGIAGMAVLLLIAISTGVAAVTQWRQASAEKQEADKQRNLAQLRLGEAETAKSAALDAAEKARAAEERATENSKEAQKQRDAAEAANREAQEQKRLADLARAAEARFAADAQTQATLARTAEAQANVQRTFAESRVVASVASNALSQPFFDPEVGVLLGLEAVDRASTSQALDVLRDSLALLSHNRNRFAGDMGPLTGIAFNPDGTHLITTDERTLRFWDLGIKAEKVDPVYTVPAGTIEGSVVSQTNGLIVVSRETNTGYRPDPDATYGTGVLLFSRSLDVLDSGGNLITTLPGGETEARIVKGDQPATREVLAFTDDQKTLILAGRNDIRAWDVSTWKMKQGFPVVLQPSISQNYLSSSLSPNARYAVQRGGGADSELYLFDLMATPSEPNLLDSEETAKVAFSDDAKYVAVANSKAIRVLETSRVFDKPGAFDTSIIEPGRLGDPRAVTKMAFSHKGDLLVLVNNNTATIRSVASADKEPVELTGHTGRIVSVMFHPKDEYVVTASEDGTARIWDVATGASLAELRGHTAALTETQFSPDSEGLFIATASADGTARLWSTIGAPSAFTLKAEKAIFSPGGNYIATFNDGDKKLSVWEGGTGRKLWSRDCSQIFLTREVFSADDNLMVLACLDDLDESANIEVVIAETGTSVSKIHIPKSALAVFSAADNDHVLLSNSDGFGLWDLKTNNVKRYPVANAALASLSPDGKFIVSGDDEFHIWNLDENRDFKGPKMPKGTLIYAGFSPDSKFVLALGFDSLNLWKVGSPNIIPLPYNDDNPVEVFASNLSAGAFSRDSKYVIFPGPKNTATVVKLEDGTVAATLEKHTATVLAASFSPDGRFVVTASADGTARVWTTENWESVAVLRGHKNEVQTATFSPDSRFILTSSSDDTSRVYSSEAFGLQAELRDLAKGRILRLPQELTSEERKRYLGELGLGDATEAPKPTPAPTATPTP